MASKKKQLADIILSMTYGELHEIAYELEHMQTDAEEFEWDTSSADGQFGLMAMLASWAESCDD